MWLSLRYKILIAMVVAVIAGVVVTALYATRSTTGAFQNYVTQGQAMRESHFAVMLTDFYGTGQTWDGVQPFITQMAGMSGERIVLTNTNMLVIADSDGTLTGKLAGPNWNSKIVGPDSTTVGYLYFNLPEDAQASMTNYLLNVTRSAWVGALIAVVIALVVTLLLSSRILKPIRELTGAARKMQNGDLSARVKVDSMDEVGELAQTFNGMAANLAKQEQLRKNMVSDVAHELRTPLSNIRGYLEAAQDGIVEPDKDFIDNLFDEAMLLNRLIDDLQELAQAESGHLHLELTSVNLGQEVQSTVDTLLPISQKLGLELTCEIQADLPDVAADPQRIGQVLRNLINNALDFTPTGSRITIQVGVNGDFVRVAVKDTGPGIASEHLPFLYERFYRADPSRSRSTGGAGLGLAIVKQLVQAQGGQVGVESNPGKGSIFYFEFPSARGHFPKIQKDLSRGD
jgi:two-component system sensor histidine kinase BaeS